MDYFFYVLIFLIQALPFVMAVLLAFAFCFFCVGSYNSPVVAVWVGAVVYVLTQVGANAALPLGLNLSLPDFYFLLLGLVLAIRMLQGELPLRDTVVRLWLLMTAVWGLLFIIGLLRYKTAAGVEFRPTFYALVSVLYLMSFRMTPERVGRMYSALYAAALALALLALYRWGAYATGVVGEWFDPRTPLRVLDSSATMVIAMAMLPGLAMWMRLNTPRQPMMLVALLLLLVVMVLGHRTVWVVTLASLGAAWWLAGHKRKGGQAGLLAPLLAGAMLLGALFVLAPQSTITREFQRSVAETQQENSTLRWRVDSWKSLVDDWVASGPLVWPAGKPFGTGNRRYIESQGMETNVGAHSHYVSLLVRGGLLVVLAYAALQWVTLRRLLQRRVSTPDWLGMELPALFIIASLVYGIGYSPDYMQALFMGLAYALAVQAGPPADKPALQARISHATRRPAHLL